MKKIIIIILILITVGVVAFYFVYNNPLSLITSLRLGSETLNGQVYQTTGSIPSQDASARVLLSQIVKLADLGDITKQNFKISVDNAGKVNVTLFPPDESSKQVALTWLKNNGFGLITESSITFTNLPSPSP